MEPIMKNLEPIRIAVENILEEVYAQLPPLSAEGARNYVKLRLHPGGFLRAVLENDLALAFGRADQKNTEVMGVWARWLGLIPRDCWGSPQKVNDWLAHEPV